MYKAWMGVRDGESNIFFHCVFFAEALNLHARTIAVTGCFGKRSIEI